MLLKEKNKETDRHRPFLLLLLQSIWFSKPTQSITLMKLRKGKVLELSKDAGKMPLKKPPDAQGIGKEKLQYRDIKVMVAGTEMCFEYPGLAKEQTTIVVLMNKLKPNLRLFPNETVDVWWIKLSVSLEYTCIYIYILTVDFSSRLKL
ncbi:uncharacterized protein LOC113331123 [Papaver somniferum]|uniref:uncharacterized protein LOC113331123 n=1 Tax=Papaver somniferum TaxID=3469 RepID=UPI000E6F4B7C|nr:uncharacterized protein LOC113331123 [Papaver somniferum]